LRNRSLFVFLGLLFLSSAAWVSAKGTQEKDFQEAQGKDNFSQKIDLTNLTPGQYNILVRTKDAAGNVSFVGPFNFYYDPTSDNPLMTVANPAPGSRVGSSQNIVGVASAPKGMSLVEAQVDGGPWNAAKGKSFWTYYFNASGLPDGPHQISVRGTDVNGVVGPVVTVPFFLDQNLPQFSLTSAKSGDRVSGTIKLEGTLSDGNGLRSLDLSTDNRQTTIPLSLAGDPKALSRTFATTLDTKRFADGPLVLWFHGVDGQGSEVRQAVLLFVDNTLPQITVLSPAANQGLHGKVRFVIQAEKTLGLKSLTAQVGDKGTPVAMAVVPGNPFRVVDLELPSTGAGVVPVIFEAVDTAGKVGRTVYNAKLNGDTDLAQLVLTDPLDKTVVRAPLRLTGTLTATDGPGAVLWSLNGAPAVRQDAGASFSFLIPGLVSGPNKLVLTPVDALGRVGKPVPFAFTAVLDAPAVSWGLLSQTDQETAFRPGLSVGPDRKAKVTGSVTWPNPLQSVTWTLGDGKPTPALVTGKGASTDFTLVFPADPPFGIVPIAVTATDTAGQATTLRSWVDIVNLAKPQGPEGLAFADSRVGAPLLVITPETPLRGYFASGTIKTAELLTPKGTVPASVLQVSHDERSLTVTDLKDGQFDNVRLHVVNDQGRVYDAPLGSLMGDTAAPVIALSSPLSGSWVRENLRIDGKVTDNNGLTRLEWSIDDGQSWAQLDPPQGQGGPFTRNFNLPGPDNLVNLLIRATDAAGRSGTVLTVVRRDTQAPQVELNVPVLAAGAKGLVYAVGRLRDEGALKSAEVTFNKKSTTLPLDKPFTLALDSETAGGTVLSFRVLDWAGNATEQNFTIPAAVPAPEADASAPPAAPKPQIEIVFPKADTKGLNGVIPIVGRVVNFTQAPAVSVKGEATGDKTLDLSDAGYFTFEVNVSALKNRSLAFTATGDAKEAASLSLNLPFDAASELPVARFLARTDKPVLTGNVTASGWIGDSRGAVSWIWQLDTGEKHTETPDPAKPPVGTFLVDLGVPPVGAHKLTVIPVNALGRQGTPAVTEFVSTTPAGPVEFTNLDLGALVSVSKDSRLQGRIPSINAWRKVEIRFADLALSDAWNGPFQPLEVKMGPDGVWLFDVPLPAALPFSRIGVVVRGEDALGQKVEGRTLFHKVWSKDPSQIADTEGLVFNDDRLDASGRFNTVPGAVLAGTFRGRPIKTVALSPAVAGLEVKADGSVVTVNAAAEGLYGPFSVVVTTVDNETFTKGPLTVFADLGGPSLTWDVPVNAAWIQTSVPVQGKVADPSGVASLEASVDGGTSWTAVVLKAGAFDVKFPVPGPDGLTRVMLRATDKGGHTTIDTRVVTKDASAPAWTLVAPPPERKVNGLTTIAGTATDLNPIVSIEYSDDGKTFKPADGTSTFDFDLDFASYAKLPDKFLLRTTDAAGNQAVTPLIIPLDQEADKPVVQIQTPAEGEVVRTDFVLSGMAFDDDGVKGLSWRLDGGPWSRLDVASFQIPIALAGLTDNDHWVEVQAEDIYGTKGNVFRSGFKVSLAPPEAVLFTPEIDKTVSGTVGLVGASFDRNGVQSVQLSLDNGLTWNRAELRPKELVIPTSGLDSAKAFLPSQRAEWEWRFDSTTLKDGTYLVMVRTTDNYGTSGLFTTLVNLDNSAPTVNVTKPGDGETILDSLDLEGRSADNIKLVSLRAELRALEGPAPTGAKAAPVGNVLLQTDLPVTPTFNFHWVIGTLTPGWYNLRFEAKDAAGNATYVARNVRIEGVGADKVEILFPQSGETLSGAFFVEGKVTSRTKVDKALVNIDGRVKATVDVDERGYYSQLFDGTNLDKGDHALSVTVQTGTAAGLNSETRRVTFDPQGPWIKVVSHQSGSYVTQRPFVLGTAGWSSPELDPSATAEQTQAYRQAAEAHKVVAVEASLDNGKTFAPAQGAEAWKFRLETLGLPDGPQPLVFRARFQDGSVAVQRLLVTVSQTPPSVQLLTNIENGRFNGSLDLAGFSTGDGQVSAVEVAVRQGDKAGYQVPTFIQGMYLDGHLWGATVWDVGLGLTFFQDAVKLQAQVGQTPPGRFWGTVAGAKLIASLAQLPMGYFFGPDWSWLSSSFGVGANFSTFSMNGNFLDFGSTQGVFLGGVVIQWEVAKALLKDLTFFKSYSWYNEATVWFISSDVQAEAKWVFSTGVRVGLF
jgi:hypothetical protein